MKNWWKFSLREEANGVIDICLLAFVLPLLRWLSSALALKENPARNLNEEVGRETLFPITAYLVSVKYFFFCHSSIFVWYIVIYLNEMTQLNQIADIKV